MKTAILAAALAAAIAAPALAQPPAPAPANAAAPAAGALSVEKTPISEILKNPKAKVVLETQLPQLPQFYERISSMSLREVVPMSNGTITSEQLAKIQAGFDQIK